MSFSKTALIIRFCQYIPNIITNYDKVVEFYWNRPTSFDNFRMKVQNISLSYKQEESYVNSAKR